jgi:gliding motility-associated-like protein
MTRLTTLFFLLLACQFVDAQICTGRGQNPSTAFPVCGTSIFTQNSVPLCGGRDLPNPSCSSAPLTDVNPFWYKFTCFQSGTLGFKITPHTSSEDYDWQVYDITNHPPNDVYAYPNLVIGSNWSGESGETGASATGTSLNICEGYGKPLWSKMPSLVQGHEYLLLVSHFTATQSGYNLSFGGGTAVITDSTPPRLKYADASCGGDVIRIKLNKKMKCSSIVTNASDFSISPGTVTISSINIIGCSAGFDTDSLELHLSSFLAPGNYSLNVKQGTDGNTVLDYCDNAIPVGDKVDFTVFPLVPTPMDSLSPVKCKPQLLRLVFRKPILCSTVAANGSDFQITGTYPVTITGAHGSCSNGSTGSREIVIDLSSTMFTSGTFKLTLKTGSDGNTIFDECGQETPAGSFLIFNTHDTVNADFSYQKFYGCTNDTVQFTHPGANGVNSWHWDLYEGQVSNQQNPLVLYQNFTGKFIQLTVSNGFCTDSSEQVIKLDNFLKADFSTFEDNCPNEPVNFTSLAAGIKLTHQWSFGDGGSSSITSPQHSYSGPLTTTPYTITYTVTDSIGCTSTLKKMIKIYSSCYLAVPSGFTPNNDGLNDYLYPLNAIKAENLDFKVFNRWGMLVFETKNWKNGWNGTYKGLQQNTGVYVWFLSYTDRDTKEHRQMKGTATLIR